jgi:hypothetical protein
LWKRYCRKFRTKQNSKNPKNIETKSFKEQKKFEHKILKQKIYISKQFKTIFKSFVENDFEKEL